MSTPLALSIDCRDGSTLNVSFDFTAGRFRQKVWLQTSEGELGDRWEDETEAGDEDWPASPPIQQLSLESINDRPTLLGVGQAGKSHWSISIEPIDFEGEAALRFDVACRTRTDPGWLGSTYRRTSINAPDRRELILQSDASCLEQSILGLQVSCLPDLPNASSADGKATKKTVRWCYWIRTK